MESEFKNSFHLSIDLASTIFSLVDFKTLTNCSLVCKNWRRVILENEWLWKYLSGIYFCESDWKQLEIENQTPFEKFKTCWLYLHQKYKQVIKETIPIPTELQIDNFVSYVLQAHSWYKHLPLYGKNFFAFLSPIAGLRYFEGTWIDFLETDGTRFHYTWMTSEKYRKSFGHLTYTYGLQAKKLITDNIDNQFLPISPSLIESGTCILSALCHETSNRYLNPTFQEYKEKRKTFSKEECTSKLDLFHMRFHPKGLPNEIFNDFEVILEFEKKCGKSFSQLDPSQMETLTKLILPDVDPNYLRRFCEKHRYWSEDRQGEMFFQRAREAYRLRQAIKSFINKVYYS